MGYVDFARQTVQFFPAEKIFFACCPDCGRLMDAAPLYILPDKIKRSGCRIAAWLQKRNTICVGNRIMRMSRKFNRCSVCGRWVCDDCFDPSAGDGACKSCAERGRAVCSPAKKDDAMKNVNGNPETESQVSSLYVNIARLTGGCPGAIRERYIALESLKAIGETYYYRWLQSGEILPEVLEDCLNAKAHFETAQDLEQQHKNKEENENGIF